MRGVAIILVCVIAGCSGEGVDLEVTSSESFDRVELFLVGGGCFNDDGRPCPPGITLPDTALKGEIYSLMKEDELKVETTVITDGKAVMHLEIGAGVSEPAGIIVVAYLGTKIVATGGMWNAHIPRHSVEIWRLDLEPTRDGAMVPETTKPATGDPFQRAQVFPRRPSPAKDGYTGCLVYQAWDESQLKWMSKFFVPANDPDCDGYEIECNAYYADYNVGTTGANLCVMADSAVVGGACVIGVAMCQDGVTGSNECRHGGDPLICVPDDICSQCSDNPAVEGCFATAIANADTSGSLYRASCSLNPSLADGGPCATARSVQVALPAGCGIGILRDARTPLTGGTLSSNVSIATVDGMTFQLTTTPDQTAGCLATIDWTAGIAPSVGGAGAVNLAIEVPYPTLGRKLIVPVKLFFEQKLTCPLETTLPTRCAEVHDGDKMFGCATGP